MLQKLGIVWSDYRFWLHFPIGAAIVLFGIWLPWIIAGALMVAFVIYEISEDRWKRDGAFIDVQGAIGGILITGAGYLIWLLIT